jgi:methylenetetrahydrofolate dehydrogenase (NADP+)/methenyltetrahydrofolate cyclohydrolase
LVLDVGFDPTLLQQADVVVCCAGVAHLITPNQLKSDAVVIDFGYSKNASGELCGDFQPPTATELENGHGSYTPTPGGTGPVLVAHILRNFYILQ